jgi:hypothetical protein
MITSNTAAKAATTIQHAILQNEGDSKNKKEINMPIDVTPNYHPVLIRASALLLPMWAGEARGCVA